MSSNISVDVGSSSDSLTESNASVSYNISRGGTIELSLDLSPLLSSLSESSQVSDNKPSSSNCANVIISSVYSFEYLAQGIYDTDGRIDIASEYGRDIYANALEFLSSKTTSYKNIIFFVCGMYT